MARNLFKCWTEVAGRIRAADFVRVFLDFDGTLAALRRTPEAASLGEPTRRALRRLAGRDHVRVVVISGRRRRDLIRRLRLSGVEYWGLYGWEQRARCAVPATVRDTVARARAGLAAQLEGVPGVRVEDKQLSFAVHVRQASPDAARQVRTVVRRLFAHDHEHDAHPRDGARLYVVPGPQAWNVLPRMVGKGLAVRDAVNHNGEHALAVYVGDDATDEPAFEALTGGITVRVGASRQTSARYRLPGPGDVRRFIERLDRELS